MSKTERTKTPTAIGTAKVELFKRIAEDVQAEFELKEKRDLYGDHPDQHPREINFDQ